MTVIGIMNHLDVTSSYGLTLHGGSALRLMVYADPINAPRTTRRMSVSFRAVMREGFGH